MELNRRGFFGFLAVPTLAAHYESIETKSISRAPDIPNHNLEKVRFDCDLSNVSLECMACDYLAKHKEMPTTLVIEPHDLFNARAALKELNLDLVIHIDHSRERDSFMVCGPRGGIYSNGA